MRLALNMRQSNPRPMLQTEADFEMDSSRELRVNLEFCPSIRLKQSSLRLCELGRYILTRT